MRIKWHLIGLVVCVALVFSWSTAWSGGEGSPPTGGVSGNEVWGVVVIDCGISRATLRIKTIDNCNVETDTYSESWGQCPSAVAQVLWFVLEGDDFDMAGLGFDTSSDLVITKVKNFAVKNNLVSFDAQFRQTP